MSSSSSSDTNNIIIISNNNNNSKNDNDDDSDSDNDNDNENDNDNDNDDNENNNNNNSSSNNKNTSSVTKEDRERKKFRVTEKSFLERLILDEASRRYTLRLSKEERENTDLIPPLINNDFETKLRNAWIHHVDMENGRFDSVVTFVKLKNLADHLMNDDNNKDLRAQLDEKNIKIFLPKKPLSGAQRRKLKKEKETALQQAEEILQVEIQPSTSSSNDGLTKRNLKPTELLGGTRGVTQSMGRKLKTLAKHMTEVGELMDEKLKRRQREKEYIIKYNKAPDVDVETIAPEIVLVDQNIKDLSEQLMKQYKRKRELEIGQSIFAGNTNLSPTMFMGNFTNGLGDTYLIKSDKAEVDETLVQLWNSRYGNHQTPSIYSNKTRRDKKKTFKQKHFVYDNATVTKKRKIEVAKNDTTAAATTVDVEFTTTTTVTSNMEEEANSDSDESSDSDP